MLRTPNGGDSTQARRRSCVSFISVTARFTRNFPNHNRQTVSIVQPRVRCVRVLTRQFLNCRSVSGQSLYMREAAAALVVSLLLLLLLPLAACCRCSCRRRRRCCCLCCSVLLLLSASAARCCCCCCLVLLVLGAALSLPLSLQRCLRTALWRITQFKSSGSALFHRLSSSRHEARSRVLTRIGAAPRLRPSPRRRRRLHAQPPRLQQPPERKNCHARQRQPPV